MKTAEVYARAAMTRVRRGMSHDVYTLPPNLPVPEDDGAADHLLGTMLPQLTLESSQGPVSLRELARERLVLYVYPRAGRPGRPPAAAGTRSPARAGARRSRARSATTPASSPGSVRSSRASRRSRSTTRSSSPSGTTSRIPVIADPERQLGAALRLPTFEVEGVTLYKRITLVAEACAIAKVFYPVFPPDRNAAEVVAWLEARA